MKKAKNDNWIKSSFSGLDQFLKPQNSFCESDENVVIKRKRPLANSKEHSGAGSDRQESNTSSLNEKHEPKSIAELCLHRKKIEDVAAWFTNVFSLGKGPRILVLSGPTGSGKTVCLKAVAREKGVQIVEWLNPVSSASDPLEDRIIPEEFVPGTYRDDRSSWISENQVSQFSEFLLRTEHYCPLPSSSVGLDDYCAQTSSSGANNPAGSTPNRILLVEDFPNAFSRDPTKFHEILRNLGRNSEIRVPVVFIMSDCPSSSLNNFRRIFPAWLLQQMGAQIQTIIFNAVASTFVVKALKQILAAEQINFRPGKSKSGSSAAAMVKSRIDGIAEISNGDLRLAVNELEFELDQFRRGWASSVSRDTDSSQSSSSASSGQNKDSTLMMFHALGKVLYAKRTGEPETDVYPLPASLNGFARHRLKEVPEEVVERSFVGPPMFNLFLHQNYLTFVASLEELETASEYLSLADLLSDERSMQDVRNGQFAASIAARGLLFASSAAQRPATWTPLHRPEWLDVSKHHNDAIVSMNDVFVDVRLNCNDAIHEILPYLPMLRDISQLSLDQQELLSDAVMIKRFNSHSGANAPLHDRDFVDDASANNIASKSKWNLKRNDRSQTLDDHEDLKKKDCFINPMDFVIEDD